MSEAEIRSFLQRLGRKLLLPTAVGAGLALGACSDDNGPAPDSKQIADRGAVDGGAVDGGAVDTQKGDQMTVDLPKFPDGLAMPYMAPDAAPLYRHNRRG